MKLFLTVITLILALLIAGGIFYTYKFSDLVLFTEDNEKIVPVSPPNQLQVLSYNVFLRSTVISQSDYPVDRAKLIGQWLSNTDLDIVTLQEVWEPNLFP